MLAVTMVEVGKATSDWTDDNELMAQTEAKSPCQECLWSAQDQLLLT